MLEFSFKNPCNQGSSNFSREEARPLGGPFLGQLQSSFGTWHKAQTCRPPAISLFSLVAGEAGNRLLYLPQRSLRVPGCVSVVSSNAPLVAATSSRICLRPFVMGIPQLHRCHWKLTLQQIRIFDIAVPAFLWNLNSMQTGAHTTRFDKQLHRRSVLTAAWSSIPVCLPPHGFMASYSAIYILSICNCLILSGLRTCRLVSTSAGSWA